MSKIFIIEIITKMNKRNHPFIEYALQVVPALEKQLPWPNFKIYMKRKGLEYSPFLKLQLY